MSTKKAIEIATRIYGLYLLVQIPYAFSGLISSFAINQEKFIKNPVLYNIWASFLPIFYIIVAILLISKAEKISNFISGDSKVTPKTDKSDPNYFNLSFWLILLGIYFFTSGTSSLIRDLFLLPIRSGGGFYWSNLFAHGFTVVAGIFMILKNELIESKILKN